MMVILFIIEKQNRVHFLNHTAVLLLELCNGRHAIPEMAANLAEAYGLDKPLEKEVVDIINRFEEEGLVTSS